MFITKLGVIILALLVTIIVFHRFLFITILIALSVLYIIEINYGGIRGMMTAWVG
jgi:hypothetical protein